MNADFSRALQCARRFRQLGLCPLPSRMDEKRPSLHSFAEYWARAVPESVYTEANWRTSNCQVMTGAKTPGATKIIVVDLDGPEAVPMWTYICKQNGYTPNRGWISRTGSGGQHYYFRLPVQADACPGGMIWGLWDTYGDDGKGKWIKHKEVRILGDGGLVVAPPSIHVDTGQRYEFLPHATPKIHTLPEIAPPWLLAMPRLVAPRCVEPPKVAHVMKPPVRLSGAFFRREEVLAAIDDKIALAASWGLSLASRGPNANGWVSCYVPGRENPQSSTPSGSFHHLDGTFQDRKDNRAISLFDLGVELGRFSTWRECRDWCGDRYIGRRGKPGADEKTGYRGR